MKTKMFSAIAVLSVGILSVSAYGSVATADTQDSKVTKEVTPITNTALISQLTGIDRCLYEMEVYPSGGVGYEDSSLPYDDYSAEQQAFLSLRAQLLRENPGSLMEVVQDGKEVNIVASTASSQKVGSTLVSEITSGASDISKAVDQLQDAGLEVSVVTKQAPTVQQICDMKQKLASEKTATGESLYRIVTPYVTEGESYLRIETTKEFASQITASLKGYAGLYKIELQSEELQLAGRKNDVAPFYGGTKAISQTTGLPCSTSFRINTSAILTASHCMSGSFRTDLNSAWIGNAMNSLFDAGTSIDAMYLGGSSYSNRVWLGNTTGQSSLPAYGIFPVYPLPNGSQLLISGASSGQGTLTRVSQNLTGTSASCAYFTNGNTYCFLFEMQAPANICIGGDSGGPVAAYDPSNGRLIPAGIVTGTNGNTSLTHTCYFTSLQAIAYAYGGATIG